MQTPPGPCYITGLDIQLLRKAAFSFAAVAMKEHTKMVAIQSTTMQESGAIVQVLNVLQDL